MISPPRVYTKLCGDGHVGSCGGLIAGHESASWMRGVQDCKLQRFNLANVLYYREDHLSELAELPYIRGGESLESVAYLITCTSIGTISPSWRASRI